MLPVRTPRTDDHERHDRQAVTAGRDAPGSVLGRIRARWPAWATDVVLTLLVLWAQVLAELKNPASAVLPFPWGVVVAATAPLALLARRYYPIAVLVVSTAAMFAGMSNFGEVVALYALGSYCQDRRLMWGFAGLNMIALLFYANAVEINGLASLLQLVVLMGFMWLLPLVTGLYARTRRDYLAGLVDRAERAEREQALIAEHARGEERTRIAREMHDVVAHQVSLVVMHAGALRTVVHKDREQAARAAGVIEEVGQQAMQELRQMLGVLHSHDASESRADSSPPKVERIPALVEASREAGLDVELSTEGDPEPMSEQVERAAYRVVQEALTNVHKHAGGSRAKVLIEHGAGRLRVEVTNTRPTDGFERTLPSSGHGLDGLRERTALVNGDITAGPRYDGGYRVRATLPTGARD